MLSLQTSPVKHADKERLMWERELLGLYISAHPLDKYETYLQEQTQPLTQLVPEYDGRVMTVGGIITSMRTIVTKSGSKMAFVAVEDKAGEGEVIVFPNLYEKIGAKLQQDAIIRVTGKNSARDRDGNVGSESKLIADDISIITDDDIATYESTGRKMDAPKVSPTARKERRTVHHQQRNSTTSQHSAIKSDRLSASPIPATPASKLFVHLKNPNDHATLVKMKSACGDHVGTTEVVLVLGEEKKSAMRLPFKVDTEDGLIDELCVLLGDDCVKLR